MSQGPEFPGTLDMTPASWSMQTVQGSPGLPVDISDPNPPPYDAILIPTNPKAILDSYLQLWYNTKSANNVTVTLIYS